MPLLPCGSAGTVIVATPEESVAVPRVLMIPPTLSRKVTVPVGVVLPLVWLTVAVSVRLVPRLAVLAIGERVTVGRGVACTSNAPMSILPLTLESNGNPR